MPARAHLAGLGLVVLGFLGCGCDDEAPAERPPAPIGATAPLAAPVSLGDPRALDLVATPDGALLLFGSEAGVSAARLDPLGGPRGAPSLVGSESHVTELVSARLGRRVGVAWVHGSPLGPEPGGGPRGASAMSLDGGERWLANEDLGPTVARTNERAGRLAIQASGTGRFVVHHRVAEQPCNLTPGPCAHVARHTLGRGDSTPEERDFLREEIERPCEPLVVAAVDHLGSGYHALCHADSTLVFVIDPDPALATPVEVGAGCAPLGLAPLDDGLAVLSRCGDRVAAWVLNERGDVVASMQTARRAAECRHGRPVLSLAGGSARWERTLGATADHLTPLLPEEIAPEGSRASWTGEALLVVVPEDNQARLRRYECLRDSELTRTDRPPSE